MHCCDRCEAVLIDLTPSSHCFATTTGNKKVKGPQQTNNQKISTFCQISDTCLLSGVISEISFNTMFRGKNSKLKSSTSVPESNMRGSTDVCPGTAQPIIA